MTPATRMLLLGGRAFSPSVLYRSSEAGLWLDQSDASTAWQESTQSTAGAVNSPVGYRSSKGGNVAGVLQATSAARPTWSQRKNLLTYSEQFDNAAWTAGLGATVTANQATAPDGTSTADLIQFPAQYASVRTSVDVLTAGLPYTYSVYVRVASGTRTYHIYDNLGNALGSFVATTSWARYSISFTAPGTTAIFAIQDRAASGYVDTYIWGAQLELGSTASTYQRIAAATDYDTSYPTFPRFDKCDAVDDNLAAVFSAGTLIDGMTLLMAIRRTSAAGLVALFRAAGSANYVGSMVSGGAGAASALSGTLEFWVNGTQVPGGTAVTEAQLHTAMPVGQWNILEVRGLDLSLWTGCGYGYFSGGYPGSAEYGEMICCPTQATARQTQLRQYLGRKYGVTVV